MITYDGLRPETKEYSSYLTIRENMKQFNHACLTSWSCRLQYKPSMIVKQMTIKSYVGQPLLILIVYNVR